MYEAYFGLNENPFNITPDPRFLYLSHQHREALDHILYGINQRKGFVMVTGGVGTGKTTLSRALLQSLDSSVDTALIFNPSISEVELLQNVLSEFHLPNLPPTATKRDYIETLNEFLLQNFSAGRNAVLIIDEAQNLSHRVLEELRLLSNLETDREKLLQIILLGQVELAEMGLPLFSQTTKPAHYRPLPPEFLEPRRNGRLYKSSISGGGEQFRAAFYRWCLPIGV